MPQVMSYLNSPVTQKQLIISCLGIFAIAYCSQKISRSNFFSNTFFNVLSKRDEKNEESNIKETQVEAQVETKETQTNNDDFVLSSKEADTSKTPGKCPSEDVITEHELKEIFEEEQARESDGSNNSLRRKFSFN